MTQATRRMHQRSVGDRCLDEGDWEVSIRPEIGASWQRSQLSGVPADRMPEVRVSDVDAEAWLLRAAGPILDRLSDEISDFPLSLLLTDQDARILDRRTGVRSLRAQLDGVTAVPGAEYGEDAMGTNGVGTCVATGRPFVVSGDEHYTEALRQLTCAAAPILNPFSGRIEGVVDITCPSGQASGLMLAFVRQAAGEIRRRLEELASATERTLLRHFLPAARRSRGPVLSVSGELVIANAAAARLLAPGDHRRLWEQVSTSLDAAGTIEQVALANGVTYQAEVVPISAGTRNVGALVRIGASSAPARTAMQPRHELAGLVGESRLWQALCAEVHAVARSPLGVVVVGEDGVGKLGVATALGAAGDPEARLTVVDAGALLAGEREWLARLQAFAEQPGTVVIRRIELLPPERVPAVAAMCVHASARLIATADDTWPASLHRRLVDQFPVRIRVPPLRDRPEDIRPIMTELISRHAADPNTVRVRPDALRVLARHPWPGNVRELEGVACQLLLRRRCGDITVCDLPPDYRGAPLGGSLTGLQLLERDAIVRALETEQGNKQAAATRLGISRSTLYRKLDAYHLSGANGSDRQCERDGRVAN